MYLFHPTERVELL
jgi:hypothetical protein